MHINFSLLVCVSEFPRHCYHPSGNGYVKCVAHAHTFASLKWERWIFNILQFPMHRTGHTCVNIMNKSIRPTTQNWDKWTEQTNKHTALSIARTSNFQTEIAKIKKKQRQRRENANHFGLPFWSFVSFLDTCP